MDYNQVFNEAKKKEGLKIIKPKTSKTSEFTKLDKIKNSIFLAGPCPREDYANNDWRTKAFEILENLCFDGYVITPTNDNYNVDDKDELLKQTQWEYEAMHKASAIVFWTDRSDKNPGFTTNCEIFDYIDCPRVYIGMPKGMTKNANRYISIHAEQRGVPIYETLEDTLAAVVKDLNVGGRKWFTSDLHLGQERTLTLSKRPFRTVEHMDLEIISNFNKRVTMNDELYILGDFGESFKYLDCMNFKTLHFVKGNYERDKVPEIMKELKGRKDVIIYDNDECKLDVGGFNCSLRHEPNSGNKLDKNEFVLFGHIHSRQMIKFMKSNKKIGGVDVGVDAHRYCPLSEEDLVFFLNAIEKGYYDNQVYDDIDS